MTLILDPDIRDWVVLPLFVIMVAAGMLRHSVGMLLQGPKVKLPSIIPQCANNTMRQASKIRSGSSQYLTTWKWNVRKQHYVQLLKQEADWCEEMDKKLQEEGTTSASDDDPMSSMMNNPLGMLKGNMAFMVQNMVMMQGIQHFFSGFILLKVPFPLTVGFKNMFQRGLAELPDLEPSYVSSVSWYFLVMYGLRSFFKLAIGELPLEVREQDILLLMQGMQNQPNPATAKNQSTEELVKKLRQESENLELFINQQHKSDIDTVERRLLGKKRYPKKSLRGSDNDTGEDVDQFIMGTVKSKKKAQ